MATFLQGRRAGLPSESTSSRSARGTRHGTQAGPGPGGSLRDEHIVSPPWTLVALPVRDRHVDRKWPVWTVEGHSRPFAYLPIQNVDQKSRTHTEPGIRNGFGREIVPFSPLKARQVMASSKPLGEHIARHKWPHLHTCLCHACFQPYETSQEAQSCYRSIRPRDE